jgi:MFS family permease
VLLGVFTFCITGYLAYPPLVLGLRALHGVSFALVFTSGSVLAVDCSPLERRAEAIGYFGTASLVTNGIGPYLAELVVRKANWGAVFWVCSGFAALALLPLALIARQSGERPESTLKVASVAGPPWNRALAACYWAFAAVGIGVGTSKTFVPALMVSSGHREVSAYFVAFTCGALIQRTVFGRLPDRFGYVRATLGSLALYAACMFAFRLVPGYLIPAVSFFLGVSHGVAYPACAALSMSFAKLSERGRVASWTTGFYNAGFGVAGSGLVWLEPWLGYGGLVALGGLIIAASAFGVARQLWVFHRSGGIASLGIADGGAV